MSSDKIPEGYFPVFELGIVGKNPAVRVLGDYTICPTTLAALATTLFEAVMKTVEECEQIQYEKRFNKALKVLMKERHNYDISYKYVKYGEEEDEEDDYEE